jgi:hypothetical protein
METYGRKLIKVSDLEAYRLSRVSKAGKPMGRPPKPKAN